MNVVYAIYLIVSALIAQQTRGEFITKMMSIYESKAGYVIPLTCPFTDVEECPAACAAYELGITAGTSPTTFSPDDKLEPYQAFMFVGRTMMELVSFEQGW